MDKLTKKQFTKRKTLWIAGELLKAIVPDGQAGGLTLKEIEQQFPKSNYFRGSDTGEIRAGLSLRGINRLVKKYPTITVDEVKSVFGMETAQETLGTLGTSDV